MNCKVCGAESGKYPLCRACNIKKEKGEVAKCEKCGNWHYVQQDCPIINYEEINNRYLYEARKALMSKTEQSFYDAIKSVLPATYFVFPQINLASFIGRTDDARFHNELFRNVDFLITDSNYKPKIVVEINDHTHLSSDRKERDEKVRKICEEAGIPILKLWASYGVNTEYISKNISEILSKEEVERIHHFDRNKVVEVNLTAEENKEKNAPTKKKKSGCYVATCVYGSYDCPPVWVLRRFRDSILSTTWYGRAFVNLYYTFSPVLVRLFGKRRWFTGVCKKLLDKIVYSLKINGFDETPYSD